nr:hypothetical protein [Candidatus Sigynarchaeota archaeon]
MNDMQENEKTHERENGSRKSQKDAIRVVALCMGFALICASVYQFIQADGIKKELGYANQEVNAMDNARTRFLAIESDMMDAYLDFIAMDYSVSRQVDEGIMNDTMATILLEGAAFHYLAALDRFQKEFFDWNPDYDPGDATSQLTIKEIYAIYFAGDEVTETIWEWNGTLNDTVEKQITYNDSIVTLYFLDPASSVEDVDDDIFNATEINAVYESAFSYNDSYDILESVVWGMPIKIYVDSQSLDDDIAELESEQEDLNYELDLISRQMVANTIAMLVISFFIDIQGSNKIVKILFLLIAAFVFLLSVLDLDFSIFY